MTGLLRLMLSSLAFMGIGGMHQINAVKTLLAATINAPAMAVFLFNGTIVWRYALPMIVAAIIGGYCGARLAREMRPSYVRWAVIAIGLAVSAAYFFGV